MIESLPSRGRLILSKRFYIHPAFSLKNEMKKSKFYLVRTWKNLRRSDYPQLSSKIPKAIPYEEFIRVVIAYIEDLNKKEKEKAK